MRNITTQILDVIEETVFTCALQKPILDDLYRISNLIGLVMMEIHKKADYGRHTR
jgi:hypothetical protein